jgi:hypothetical protein
MVLHACYSIPMTNTEIRLNGRLVILSDDEGYVFADTREPLTFEQVEALGLDATLRNT